MLLVILLWILAFFIFIAVGYSVIELIARISKIKNVDRSLAETFFMGFLVLSVITGFLSIWIPIGYEVLIVSGLIAILLFIINYNGMLVSLKKAVLVLSSLSWLEIFILSFIVLFILLSVAQPITWGDTESYHVQTIQWIRKYAVVPGLGNIHERFAFNPMFFVVSGAFSFQIRDILIFPLNGVCYVVLMIKLFLMSGKEFRDGVTWKAVFYSLTLLVSLLILIPSINSPSTDAICGILIMYLFVLLMDKDGVSNNSDYTRLVLINMLIFSCVTFKLSSIFIIITLIILLNKESLKRGSISLGSGIIIITPFIIRNYFLSGYLVYPFPAVDIFNVDWKVPYENVLSMKLEVEGWAKISTIPYPEVVRMGIHEWILPWFKSLGFSGKLILSVNSLSIIMFVVMMCKKDFFLAKVQLIILINLVFWLFMAPDIRFVYGFLFIGFSLTVTYIIKLLENFSSKMILKLVKVGLACILILVIGRRIMPSVDTLIHPSFWVIPAPFGSVETETYATNFEYRVPVQRGGCFNVEIPCVPIPFDNVVMRTSEVKDGFKVDRTNYSGIHYIN